MQEEASRTSLDRDDLLAQLQKMQVGLGTSSSMGRPYSILLGCLHIGPLAFA